jgi:3-phenylpropionate/trans-cinnamate dioxygenase ferredoxin subunit
LSFVRFASLAEIPPGNHKTLRIGLKHVVVYNVEGELYAIEDACSHMKAPLSGGRLRGTRLTCARHGWVYDITTGRRTDKDQGCVRTFPIHVEGGTIMVDTALAVSPTDHHDLPGDEDDLPPFA